MTVQTALSWSGGKDSALTLWDLRREGVEPGALITTVTDTYERISMHGVRRELLARQANAVGIPLVEVGIPPGCVNEVYEARMAQAFASPPLSEVEAVAFGDLFLEDIRAYREERLRANGRRGVFPLWGRDTAALARAVRAPGSPTCTRGAVAATRAPLGIPPTAAHQVIRRPGPGHCFLPALEPPAHLKISLA